MNLKKFVSTGVLGGAVLGALALAPGMADAAPLSGVSIQPQSVHLTVTDDDSTVFGTSTTVRDYFISLPAKTVSVGQTASWSFGGCSGPQGDGEVWTQVKVTASVLTPTFYQVNVHLDLYEDTSSTCGGRTVNFPLSQLDFENSTNLGLSGTISGQLPPASVGVGVSGGATLDRGDLVIGFQATSV